jgi:hypothetical protein
MYSRSYGRGDISAKITPPPAYSGSAISGGENGGEEKEEAHTGSGAFAPFSQNITFPKHDREEEKCEICEQSRHEEKHEKPEHEERCEETPRKEKGFLSSPLPDLSKEDLILIGIIIALAFDLADRDILLVALVAAAVIM